MERLIDRQLKNIEKAYDSIPMGGKLEFSKSAVESLYQVLKELREYIDAEERGLLLRVPCKIGDTLYGTILNELKEYVVFAINIGMREHENSCVVLVKNHRNSITSYELNDFGKTIFLTRSEAEQALKGMEVMD